MGLLLLFVLTLVSVDAAPQARPNILLILADDLAWSDLRCYGHAWHDTPALDHLASEGMRFTAGYAAAPICSASRAGLQTGKSPARLGFEFVTKDKAGSQSIKPPQPLTAPPYTLNLPVEETTVAEVLAGAGYQTAFFGKWHLNAHYQHYLGWSPEFGPPRQGYQVAVEDFGSHPYAFPAKGPQPETLTRVGEFPRDTLVDQAAAFVKGPHPEPFFAMMSHFYVHTPVRTPCQWLLDKYDARVPQDAPNRTKQIAYAAFVETLDHYVGELVKALDTAGLRDSTLLVFTSDNGGHPEFAANAPLRGSKWNLYEGGIREPFIVRWPGRVVAGGTSDEPVVGYDLLPTFAEVAGAALPDVSLDGRSFVPALKGETMAERPLYWHFPYYHPETGFEDARVGIGVNDFEISQTRPQSAIRQGRYKLIHFYESGRSELYNLQSDPGEAHDLSRLQPERAAALEQQLLNYLRQAGARFPQPSAGR